MTELAAEEFERIPKEIRLLLDPADAWAIRPDTRKEFLEAEARRRYRLYKVLGEGKDPVTGKRYRDDEILEKRDVFKRTCAQDPVFFSDNCIWTRDPEGKVGFNEPLVPLVLFKYEKDLWFEPWIKALSSPGSRTRDKSRRMRASIDRMVFEIWAFRFLPGSTAWVSSDKVEKIDRWYDFDSLLGKFRVMWDCCVDFLPWLFPELPPHSEWNQLMYLRFPEWKEGGKSIDPEVHGNQLKGVLPADPRGGAAARGFGDEAGYILHLKDLLDGAGSMTRDLELVSSAPPDVSNLFWRRRDLKGVEHNVAPWWMNPMNVLGLHWSDGKTAKHGDMYPGEMRGPWTRKWRSDWLNGEYAKSTSTEAARNIDIDPLAAAGSRVFLNFDPLRVCGQKEPKDPTWDLYDPNLELQVWYDPGRGDPWAFIWVQLDYEKGFVNIVDYDMSSDKTIHYFVPMFLGWPWERKALWRTAPEAQPWAQVVPWSYDEDRIARIKRWNGRRHHRGGRVKMLWGGYDSKSHNPTDLYSVEERLARYDLYSDAVPSSYNRDNFLERTDEILLRTRISGFLVGFRPEGRHPAINEALSMWRRHESSDRSRPGKAPDPIHDENSHPCTAFMHGASQIAMLMSGRVKGEKGKVEPYLSQPPSRVIYGGEWR